MLKVKSKCIRYLEWFLKTMKLLLSKKPINNIDPVDMFFYAFNFVFLLQFEEYMLVSMTSSSRLILFVFALLSWNCPLILASSLVLFIPITCLTLFLLQLTYMRYMLIGSFCYLCCVFCP